MKTILLILIVLSVTLSFAYAVEIDSKQRTEISDDDVCGPGTELIDGICKIVRTTEPTRTIGSDPSPAMYLGPLILLFGIIGLIAFLIHRREEN